MSNEPHPFVTRVEAPVPWSCVRTEKWSCTMLNTNRKLFIYLFSPGNKLRKFQYVCFCELPCWAADPERCLEGPLAASVHRQLPPAAARHPGEENKNRCPDVCLVVFYDRKVQLENPRPWLSFCFLCGHKAYNATALPQIFTLAGCKGLWKNI